MINSSNMSSMYYMIELSRANVFPLRQLIHNSQDFYDSDINPLSYTKFGYMMRASLDIAERITRKYDKPEFDIKPVDIGGKSYIIKQKIILRKPFCNLIHFEKNIIENSGKNFENESKKLNLPKLLIVAPLAGHHATLLKSTVQDCLKYFDVYITDWIDAAYVPMDQGSFDMDDYIDYIIEFLELLGTKVNVMAVCQPTVPVLAATAIMSSEGRRNIPSSLILMGGPIDARQNPTAVNDFATARNLDWFKRYLITRVPHNYPGFMREVYPGFLQLAGFIGMNFQKHASSHFKLYQNLILKDFKGAAAQKAFYDEYLSVMDLPAEFYLQTIKEVFQEFSLATGKLVSRGRYVNLSAIKKTSLLGIEGERDDIAGVGQTKAALKLCTNIKNKEYYLQKDVGHYGVFTGSKFREFVLPTIKNFVYKN